MFQHLQTLSSQLLCDASCDAPREPREPEPCELPARSSSSSLRFHHPQPGITGVPKIKKDQKVMNGHEWSMVMNGHEVKHLKPSESWCPFFVSCLCVCVCVCVSVECQTKMPCCCPASRCSPGSRCCPGNPRVANLSSLTLRLSWHLLARTVVKWISLVNSFWTP